MKVTHPSRLGDAELAQELTRLARAERETAAALVLHLAEFDARRLYEPAGYSSLFKYCRAVLRLSEDAVFTRIEVARAARRYPVIFEMLAVGTLSLTTARLLAPKLTRENQSELLAAAAGKGKRDIEIVLAGWFPQPDVPFSIRRVPERVAILGAAPAVGSAGGPEASEPAASSIRPSPLADGTPVLVGAIGPSGPTIPSSGSLAESPTAPAGTPAAAVAALPPARPVIRPLAPERFEVRFTASASTCAKLRQAQDLLSHAVPGGDVTEVIDRALTVLVRELSRRKFAETSRPRPRAKAAADSRSVRAEVRRAVSQRDDRSCAFIGAGGRRCGETRFLEFHHLHPRAAGGTDDDGVELRCRAHNGHEVELFFGPQKRYRRPDAVPLGQDGGAGRSAADHGTRVVPERPMESAVT